MSQLQTSAKPRRVRYPSLAMIFIVTAFNYVDRATLSVAAPAMRHDLGFDAVLMGVAESPAFPANNRLTVMWFPRQERGLATAMFQSEQYFALAVFTPLMVWLLGAFAYLVIVNPLKRLELDDEPGQPVPDAVAKPAH